MGLLGSCIGVVAAKVNWFTGGGYDIITTVKVTVFLDMTLARTVPMTSSHVKNLAWK